MRRDFKQFNRGKHSSHNLRIVRTSPNAKNSFVKIYKSQNNTNFNAPIENFVRFC